MKTATKTNNMLLCKIVASANNIYVVLANDTDLVLGDAVYDEQFDDIYEVNPVVLHNKKSMRYPHLRKVICTNDSYYIRKSSTIKRLSADDYEHLMYHDIEIVHVNAFTGELTAL